jgi:hypothetical protein
MLTQTLLTLKNWWIAESTKIKEIESLESKHTKIRFDKDIYEVIRIH